MMDDQPPSHSHQLVALPLGKSTCYARQNLDPNLKNGFSFDELNKVADVNKILLCDEIC